MLKNYGISIVNGLQKFFVAAVVMLIGVLITEGDAFCQAFLFPGVEPSTEAGLSQTNTRGVTAVMTNPANIAEFPSPHMKKSHNDKGSKARGVEVYGDISILSVNYTYARGGYETATVSTVAPPITFGVSWRPIPKFALGLEIVPRPALSPQVVKNLTVEQSGDVSTVNATSKQGTILTALGAATKFSKFVSLGFTIMETAEDNTLTATEIESATDTPLVQMAYKGSFLQAIVGGRFTPNPLSLIGVSYKTAMVKKYTGVVSLSGAPSDVSSKQGYLPAVFAMGGEYDLGGPVIFAELRHEFWNAGSPSVRSGLPGSPTSTALQDTNIIIFGGRYLWKNGNSASAAIGKYPPNVQFGSPLDGNGKADSDAVGGIEFGDFDALDRYAFAGGYKFMMKRGFVQGGMNIQQGSRSVSPGYRNAGEYKLSVFTITGGIGKDF